MRSFNAAFADLRRGASMRRVWLTLAREDITDQHRMTALGPVWLLINYLAFAGIFILIFDTGEDGAERAAYVATGLLVWLYISEVITQSVALFSAEESFIKGTTLPLSVYVMRLATQSVIRAAYALAGCILILLFADVPVLWGWLWALPSIALLLAAAPAAIILFAFLGAYLPDSRFFVGNLMRIGMFLTPVFWMSPRQDGGVLQLLYDLNPFTYYLDIVRVPILTGALPWGELLFCLAISGGLWLAALLVLGRYGRQLVFVL